ncbi:MAG TPA: molecular chaperone DnaJ [Actinomycetota bacterium]|nr:molecular chaperone DnaJ [Actinomycetota bacterium]
MPDYYAILGVPQGASADEIKRAYRKLARESHPDANPTDPHAEEKFKQIGEAYEVLSDPAKRRQYDTFGDAGGAGGFGGFGDIGDIMDAFFGGSPFGRARTRTRTAAVPGQDVGTSVTLTFEQAVFGTSTDVVVQAQARCERCNGDGCEPGTFRSRCNNCGGLGEIRASRNTILGTVMTSRPCPVCEGVGEAPAVPCTKCNGQGRELQRRNVKVEVPAGVDDGTTLRMRGYGEGGVRGGADGDLFIRINVKPHEFFARNGDDLECELNVPLTQAVLGADIPVQTIDGPETVNISPGTQHGTIVKLRGRGVPRLDGRGRGDLLVHVTVDIPAHVKGDERTLFEKLAEIRGETVSGEHKGIFRRLRDSFLGE